MSWLAWASAAWDHAPVWASGAWGSDAVGAGSPGTSLSASYAASPTSAAAGVSVVFTITVSGSASYINLKYDTAQVEGANESVFTNVADTVFTTTKRYSQTSGYTTRLQWSDTGTTPTGSTTYEIDVTASSDPSGEFKTPVDNQAAAGLVRVSASATDAEGISSVSFWIAGVYTTTIFTAPYGFSFDSNPYGHSVSISASARFEDVTENYFSPPEVWVTGEQSLSASFMAISPIASIPGAGTYISGAANYDVTYTITISGSASFVKLTHDALFPPEGVYFNNSTFTAHTTTIRYSAQSNPGGKGAQLTWAASPPATAASLAIVVYATASSDPTGGFSEPANGQSVSGSVRLSASATDAAGVSSVTFWLNGALTTTIYAAPYGFNFDSSLYGTGVTISASSRIEDNTRNFGTMAERWLITDLTPGAAIAGGLGGIKFVPLGGVGGTKKAVGAVVPGKSRRTT